MFILIASWKTKEYSHKKARDILFDFEGDILIARKDDEDIGYTDVTIKKYYS